LYPPHVLAAVERRTRTLERYVRRMLAEAEAADEK
jgi:hypothetical protein